MYGGHLWNGWKQYHIPNPSVTTIVCELAPHPSRALHSHSLFVPTAPEDHSTGVRNTAKNETGKWEFGLCRASREVSKAFAVVVASAIWTSD